MTMASVTSLAPRMKRVAVAELKAHLSAYVRRIKAGESFIITSRGIPVAKFTPFTPEPADSELMSLVARGLIELPARKVSAREIEAWIRKSSQLKPSPRS